MNIILEASYQATPVNVQGRMQATQSIPYIPVIYNIDRNLSVLYIGLFFFFLKHERYILRLGFPVTSTC